MKRKPEPIMRGIQPLMDMRYPGEFKSKCLECGEVIEEHAMFHDCKEGEINHYVRKELKAFGKEMMEKHPETWKTVARYLEIQNIDWHDIKPKDVA